MSSSKEVAGPTKGLVAQDGKPLDSMLAPRCGNCTFWHIDLAGGSGRGFCYGEPPKIMMIAPPRQGAGGRAEYSIEMFRPLIEKTSPPCALHKPRMDA